MKHLIKSASQMVIRHTGGLQGEEIEIKKPPLIYFQVWDKDVLSRDEYLGALELNLSDLPMPYKSERRCKPFPNSHPRINLFNRTTVEGWFPLVDNQKKSSVEAENRAVMVRMIYNSLRYSSTRIYYLIYLSFCGMAQI